MSKSDIPLTNPIRKNTPFFWDDKCHKTFDDLNWYLTLSQVLIIPRNDNMFVVFTNAPLHELGAKLMQQCQVISFISR